ncbi:unnamed protein product, partial [Didymodactylos carnosus]
LEEEDDAEIGNGIKEAIAESKGHIKREDIFITTKIWNQYHKPDDAEWAVRDSLNKLKLDYVDLVLIHWPIAFKKIKENRWSQSEDKKERYYEESISLEQTWEGLEKLVEKKLTHSIGLSNFNSSEIERILKVAKIKPVTNQIELHPYLNQKELRDYCHQHQITITSYCPLSNLKREGDSVTALNDPVIEALGKKYNKTSAQIIIRWHLQHGLIVIPKTVTPQRLIENADVFDFELTTDDVNSIDKMGEKNLRFINPAFKPGNKGMFD